MSDEQKQTEEKSNQIADEQSATQAQGGSAVQMTEVELLQEQLEQEKQKCEQMTQMAQRALADLQNFKRRTDEDKARFALIAGADFVRAILPSLDHLNLALKHAPTSEALEWVDSIRKINEQLLKDLGKKGFAKIPTAGEKLDPTKHEALMTAAGEKDVIVEELEAGYMLGDFVVKPALVKVGDGS
jgi:molecular chaperone GrpE